MTYFLRSLLAVFLLFAFTEIQSQIRSGQTIGVNISTMEVTSNGHNIVPESSTGIHFGGMFDIPVIGNFTFRPAFLFSGKGSMYMTDSTDISISPVYIEVPALAVYRFGPHSLKFSLFAGPYVALGFGGNKIENGGTANKINYGSGENDDIRHFDAGVNMGAGICFKDLMLSVQYGIGMADILPGSIADPEIKNRVIGISITSFVSDKK